MITRYYDTFRSPAFDLLDSFGIFGTDLKTHRADSVDGEGIKIEMPGVGQSDLDVTVEGRMLKITGKSRTGRDFSYTYTLKSNVDETAIQAHLQDGLLEVKLPKKADSKARKIPVT